MTTMGSLATVLVALTLFGCKGTVQTSAAASAVEGADGASSAGGTRIEYLKDPTLNNMNAVPVTIPANWRFQGALFQGGKCTPEPYSVYRATSPDGKSFSERMPVLGWVWGTGPMIGFTPKDGCLPLKGPMSAQDFLKYLAATMNVTYVSDEQVSAEDTARIQKELRDLEAAETNPPKQTRDLASASVRYTNGTTAMKGLLNVVIRCTETVTPGMQSLSIQPPVHVITGPSSTVDQCAAYPTYTTGPESQYAGLVREWDVQGMGSGLGTQAWQAAWTQREIAGVQQMSRAMTAASMAQMQARQQQFDRSMVVQQQMHEQFLSTMARGTASSMANAQASTNARTTAASDWVDYALDRQTVMSTNTGQTYKITNQVKAGGDLQQVHGNGTP